MNLGLTSWLSCKNVIEDCFHVEVNEVCFPHIKLHGEVELSVEERIVDGCHSVHNVVTHGVVKRHCVSGQTSHRLQFGDSKIPEAQSVQRPQIGHYLRHHLLNEYRKSLQYHDQCSITQITTHKLKLGRAPRLQDNIRINEILNPELQRVELGMGTGD